MAFFKKGNVKEDAENGLNGLYEELFFHHPDGVFTLDSFDSIQEVNTQFAQQLGFRTDDLAQSAFSSLIALEDIKRYLSFLRNVLNGEAQNIQLSLLHKKGHQVVTHLTLLPIRKKDEVTGVYGFARKMEINREGSETRLDPDRSTGNIEHAQLVGHFGIWKYDVHNKESYCSRNMCLIFGWECTIDSSEDEFKTSFDFVLNCIHIEDRDRVVENFNQAVTDGLAYEQEYRIYTKDGERYILSQGNAVKDEKGRIVRLIGTVHDLTEQRQAEKEKSEMEQLYKSLFTHVSDATFLIGANGKRQAINQATLDMLGLTKQEMLQRDFTSTVHPKDLKLAEEKFKAVIEGGVTQTFELTLLHKDGHFIHINTIWAPVIVHEQVVGIIGISKNITRQKEDRRRLEESEQRYRSLFVHNPDSVFSFDLDGNFLDCNPALGQLLGYSKEELLAGPFVHLVHPDDLPKTYDHFARAAMGETQNYDVVCIHKEGYFVDVNVTNIPITVDGNIVGVYGIAKDMTEQKKVMELHSFLAYHDPLTNLPNRRWFEQKVEEFLIIARTCNQKLAVMYVDLDRFKYINDTLGHEIGDQLLQCVTERLKKSVREGDVVGRMGGDEFTILLPMVVNIDQAVEIAEAVRTTLEKPFEIGQYELFITSSVGISMFPFDGDDVRTLLKNADTALYRAKEYGEKQSPSVQLLHEHSDV